MSNINKKIFITGSLGYVGGRCSKRLAGEGYELLLGSRKAEQLESPSWLKRGNLVQYSTENSTLELVETLKGVDIVIHMASPNEIVSGAQPEVAIYQNGVGTFRLCEAAVKAGVKQFLFFSTAHVYSSPLMGVFDESSETKAAHPYSYSHLMAECIVRSFAGANKIPDCKVVRLTNSFGAPERLSVDRWTLLVNDLCKQAMTTGNLKLTSDGSGLRDFICMSDVEAALLHLIKHATKNSFELFNLGSGTSISVFGMATVISEEASKLLGKEVAIERPKPAGLPVQGELQIKIQKLLDSDFKLKNDVRQEIRETLQLCAQFTKR